MKVFSDTTVYILCPANIFTGGPTLLHQLASQLTSMGIQAKMVYLSQSGTNQVSPVAEEYKKYHLDWTTIPIPDDEKSILIFFEAFPFTSLSNSKIRKIIWWLSVDNYIFRVQEILNRLDLSRITTKPLPRFFYFDDDEHIMHWCQSEYARQFIRCNGVQEKDILMVGDYLENKFLLGNVNLISKKDMVVFNPKKGMETTMKIMAQRPDINWKPIQNMTPQQVRELLLVAKVYIDFGHHPGKDRIPREAALSGCVVITGRKGAAANDVDIDIPDDFKIHDDDFKGILEKIDEILADFLTAYKRQADYRKHIKLEKENFRKELLAAFEMENMTCLQYSAVLNDERGYGLDIVSALLDMEDSYKLQFIIDDRLAQTGFSSSLIFTEKGRRYLLIPDRDKIEILTCADANFLYMEGRIHKIYVKDNGNSTKLLLQQLPEVRNEDVFLV
ncbi:hypothetical protein SAMN05216582_11334 [Selenomonas ruminantium]|uniref:Glycosyltransferase family 1 protein n=1 Tax=Selenomonas ruminantium TaxID=971 RepID=A0A1M6UM34_SELRU|nr:hypothetical protein [Selenomonas ruminantium]SHK70180.1 hypothetical protein SAMN05216582_11334 [Selenomonas ruminantium]